MGDSQALVLWSEPEEWVEPEPDEDPGFAPALAALARAATLVGFVWGVVQVFGLVQCFRRRCRDMCSRRTAFPEAPIRTASRVSDVVEKGKAANRTRAGQGRM